VVPGWHSLLESADWDGLQHSADLPSALKQLLQERGAARELQGLVEQLPAVMQRIRHLQQHLQSGLDALDGSLEGINA